MAEGLSIQPRTVGQAVAVVLSLLATAFGGGIAASHLGGAELSDTQVERIAARVADELGSELAAVSRTGRATARLSETNRGDIAANATAIEALRQVVRMQAQTIESMAAAQDAAAEERSANRSAAAEIQATLSRIAAQLESRGPPP